jgi:hypothetical protein
MSQDEPETSAWSGVILVAAGILMLLLVPVVIFVRLIRQDLGGIPFGREEFFSPGEALLAAVALGPLSILVGIAELKKTPPHFSLRALLIAVSLFAVAFGLMASVVWLFT